MAGSVFGLGVAVFTRNFPRRHSRKFQNNKFRPFRAPKRGKRTPPRHSRRRTFYPRAPSRESRRRTFYPRTPSRELRRRTFYLRAPLRESRRDPFFCRTEI